MNTSILIHKWLYKQKFPPTPIEEYSKSFKVSEIHLFLRPLDSVWQASPMYLTLFPFCRDLANGASVTTNESIAVHITILIPR